MSRKTQPASCSDIAGSAFKPVFRERGRWLRFSRVPDGTLSRRGEFGYLVFDSKGLQIWRIRKEDPSHDGKRW